MQQLGDWKHSSGDSATTPRLRIQLLQITVFRSNLLRLIKWQPNFIEYGIFFNSTRTYSPPFRDGGVIFAERKLCARSDLGTGLPLDPSKFFICPLFPSHNGVSHNCNHGNDYGDWQQHGQRSGDHGSNGLCPFPHTDP